MRSLPNRPTADEILDGIERRSTEETTAVPEPVYEWTDESGNYRWAEAYADEPVYGSHALPDFFPSERGGWYVTSVSDPNVIPRYSSRPSRFDDARTYVDSNDNIVVITNDDRRYEFTPEYIRTLMDANRRLSGAEIEAVRAHSRATTEYNRDLERQRRNRRIRQEREAAEVANTQAAALDWSSVCQCQGCYNRRVGYRHSTTFGSIVRRETSEPERPDGFFVCVGCHQACPNHVEVRQGRRSQNVQTLTNYHTICNSCAGNSNIVFMCQMCASLTLVDERTTDTVTGQNWCHSCQLSYGTDSNNQRPCRRCSNRYDVVEGAFDERGECRNCRRRNLIRSYDANVLQYCTMVGEPKDGIFLGVELEVEPHGVDRFEAAERLQNAIPFGILKRDGSLSEDGIEIVSAPIAFENFYSGMWDDFFKEETLEGLRSAKTDTCGMHVHVSRAPLTKLQIGKVIAFVHNPANRAFIEAVAQRPSNYYGDFRRYKTETEIFRDVSDRNNRYTAVNLRNPHTVEFRIFKGTINRVTFFKNIEFCHALVKYCGGTSRSLGEAVNCQLFSAFVFQERKTYPHLWQFLVKRGFCPVFKNVYEFTGFVKELSMKARNEYPNERAKNMLTNGLTSVRPRDMNYYRGEQVVGVLRGGGIISGRLRANGSGGWQSVVNNARSYTARDVYDIVRNHERNEILNTLRSEQVAFEDVPTPENSPEYTEIWGACTCTFCEGISEQERQYEQERLGLLRERYNAFANRSTEQTEPGVEPLSDLLDQNAARSLYELESDLESRTNAAISWLD